MEPIRTISLGAGLQSSTLVEMAVEGELPRPDYVLFADTCDEPAYVYRQLWYLAGRLATVDVPLIITGRGSLIADAYRPDRRFAPMPLLSDPEDGSRPGRLRRQCTHEYKIEPLQMCLRRLLLRRGLTRRYRDGKVHPTPALLAQGVESWIGITVDEAERMRRSRVSWIRHRWPLIELRMTRADCAAWLRAHELPIPGKSSCRHCPYHNDDYWRQMKEQRPADWADVVRFDRDLRNGKLALAATASGTLYLHHSARPLEQAIAGRQPALLETADLCGGYCWT